MITIEQFNKEFTKRKKIYLSSLAKEDYLGWADQKDEYEFQKFIGEISDEMQTQTFDFFDVEDQTSHEIYDSSCQIMEELDQEMDSICKGFISERKEAEELKKLLED